MTYHPMSIFYEVLEYMQTLEPPIIDTRFTKIEADARNLIDDELLSHSGTESISINIISRSKLSTQNIEALYAECNKAGLTIQKIYDSHVRAIGSATSMRTMFGVMLERFVEADTGVVYYGHTSSLIIPASLYFVSDVMGLSNMPVMRPHFQVNDIGAVDIDTDQDTVSRALRSYFTPIQIANLYKMNKAYNGKGQTIAIIELGGGFNQSDMNTYFRALGIAAPKIISVSVNGATNNPTDPSGASMEVVLDIQIAGAVANAATIVVYYAPNSFLGFYNAIYKAVTDTRYRPSIVSISWGAPEPYWPPSSLTSYNNLFAYAVSRGINIFCAAGDNGSTDGVSDGLSHTDFPAASPNVVACGGTTLMSDGLSILNEVVWFNHPNSSTGGGFSAVFAKPAYQNGVTSIGTKRGVPDIAGNADPSTGYLIYMNRSFYVVGGTSAVSPLMAGLTAKLNQMNRKTIGFMNPMLYVRKPCNDITIGSNGAYSSTTGWDNCTGWGTPDGSKMNTLTSATSISKLVKKIFNL